MTKHLLFYWYANTDDFMNRFSLLHLHALNLYKDIFDKKTFIISMDNPDTDTVLYTYTVKLISAIVPDAEFIKTRNHPDYASEAWWVKKEFIPNMSKYKDEAVFWCHGKGKGGLRYTDKDDLFVWIALLYYANLGNGDIIDKFINDDETYMMGTLYYPIKAWYFSTWHYHGGFYWLKPDKVDEYMRSHDTSIFDAVNCTGWEKRYIAEGLPGIIFKKGEHCMHINDLYFASSAYSHKDYLKNNFSKKSVQDFDLLFGQFLTSMKLW